MKVIAVSGSPRQEGAELIGGIDVLAWDKEDLVHDRPQQLRLARFASEIRGKITVLPGWDINVHQNGVPYRYGKARGR